MPITGKTIPELEDVLAQDVQNGWGIPIAPHGGLPYRELLVEEAKKLFQTGSQSLQIEKFNAIQNQINFTMTKIPGTVNNFILNGVAQDTLNDISLFGNTVTWLNNLFNLDAGDKIVIEYFL